MKRRFSHITKHLSRTRHYLAAGAAPRLRSAQRLSRRTKQTSFIAIAALIVISSSGALPQKFASVLPGWVRKARRTFYNLQPLSPTGSTAPGAADAQQYAGQAGTIQKEASISQQAQPLAAIGAAPAKLPPSASNSPMIRQPKPSDNGQTIPKDSSNKPKRVKELAAQRNEFERVYQNDDGSKTLERSLQPTSYKQGTEWKDIDTSLEDNSAKTRLQTKSNSWRASFSKQDIAEGVELSKGASTFSFKPVGGQASKPVVSGQGKEQAITYKDVWPGVDVIYEVKNNVLKESLIVKNAQAAHQNFSFQVQGAELTPDAEKPGWYKLGGAFSDVRLAAPTMATKDHGIAGGTSHVTQTINGGTIMLAIDQAWLAGQKKEAFPLTIDPSFEVGAATNFAVYTSQGFSCGLSQGCGHMTGNVFNEYWRFIYYVPYTQLQGKTLLNATLHLEMPAPNGDYWGTYDPRYISVNRATCWGYNCKDNVLGDAVAAATDYTNIDVTHLYQYRINTGDWGTWFMVNGEEIPNYESFKHFNAYETVVSFTYNTPAPMTTPAAAAPADKSILATTQPSLITNAVAEPDGDHVYYSFRVATNPDGETGTVINSNWQSSVQWTVPDGVLQDGVTYYWRAYAWDGVSQTAPTAPNWTRSFRVDMRGGKDSTQTFDSAGAADVNLATGNLTTSGKTHSIAALGGTVGLGMEYDSPQRSRQGLVGEYWNLPGSWSGTPPTSAPNVTRVDQRIDFPWGEDSALPVVVNNDWFYSRWTGYFVAPATGTYYFGAHADDQMKVIVNNQEVFNGPCWTGNCYGSTITLNAGQVVPIRVEHVEGVSTSFAQLFVKGAVPEQIVPTEWLQTGVRPTGDTYGLSGRYYPDSNNHVFPTDENQAFLARTDANLSFNWGSAAPVPNATADNFMVRWTGYVTAPTAGTYYFYTSGDDGSRVKVNENLVWDRWNGGSSPATSVTLAQGQTLPITVEYYEANGNANVELRVFGAVYDQTVPGTWLSPRVNALPAGWKLGADADGDLSYDHARIGSNSVTLYDIAGDSHEYTWTGSGYKPPVKEDGNLVRNTDGTLTLQDIDGRTYLFNKDGNLQATTTPLDDRKPASLRYEYSGTPARLTKVVDGADSTRYGELLYAGDTSCPSIPSGFGSTPTNMLCAYRTSNGDVTKFFYSTDGRLTRVELPGQETSDWGYDSLGRITQARSSLANDAIIAGVRANDDTATTQFAYDLLGRISTATQPAPQANAARTQHAYEYFVGDSRMHVTGGTEPNGFSRKITYDTGFRTVSDTDIANLTDTTEWDTAKDLVLATTDEAGQKSTTLYDRLDRPTHKYGPAPAAWFASDRTPLSAYASQVPHTETKYDEGMAGLEAAYFNYGANGKVLSGAPKLHGTGIGPTDGTIAKTWNSTAPITPDSGYNWGARLTGEIRLDATGSYYFRPYSDDGLRMWIDDQLVVDDWNDGAQRWHPIGLFNNTTANSYHRIRIDYYDRSNGDARLELYTSQPNGGGESLVPGSIFGPKYGLATTSKTYDAAIGDVEAKTNYGTNPELGLAGTNTLDPTGLNYQTASTYEAPGGTNSYLRQLTKTLPGGSTTNYAYYNSTETRDNPCTPATEAFKQAGMLKIKTEPDPDGTGSQTGRSAETVYDDVGRVVASRYNTDAWTCTTYDTRGRVATIEVPALLGNGAGRSIANNYAVDGNPLTTSATDDVGTIVTTVDLLGRTTYYRDVHNTETTTTYDNFGRVSARSGDLGGEVFTYDSYNRLIDQKLDGTTLAAPHYDAYSRVDYITYPNAGQQKLTIGRDALGRVNSHSYTLGNGTAGPSDSVVRSQSGQITSGAENGTAKSYTYDKAGRLTAATIGSNTYSYGFGTQSSTCGTGQNMNANAGKNANRTTQTINGTTTTYCYDKADRLITSSNTQANSPQYDPHGNTTQIGTNATPLRMYYDSSDRNTGFEQYNSSGNGVGLYYDRDVQNRIIGRFKNTISNWNWLYAGDYFLGVHWGY